MFGFNKKNRLIEGPIEFTAEVEIERPAAEVFPLVDMADPRFIHAQLGAKVERVKGAEHRFDMTIEAVEDAVFEFTVLERVEGQRHALSCVIVPQLFALEKSVEAHVIEPISDTACRVKLTTNATFDPGLSDDEVAGEIATMSMAVTGELEKLKVLAEDGIGAVKAMEEAEMGFDIELGEDLGDGFNLGELDIDWDDIEPQQ